jgi:hypothetical protein
MTDAAPALFARLSLPDTDVARKAYTFAQRATPAFIVDHGIRSYIFARAAHRGLRPGTDYDDELVFVSCILHDIGLSEPGNGDDVYQSLTTRGGRWGQLIQGLTEKLAGRTDMAFPLVHGIGPTPIPRQQRMYLRFAAPIDTTKPARVSAEKWVTTIKQSTEESLQQALADLLTIRSNDPHPRAEPTGLGHCDPVTDRALTPGTLSAGDTIRPATSCAARPTRTATAIRARHCTNTPTSRGLRSLALISDEGHGLIALPRIFRPHESALRAAAQRYARPV